MEKLPIKKSYKEEATSEDSETEHNAWLSPYGKALKHIRNNYDKAIIHKYVESSVDSKEDEDKKKHEKRQEMKLKHLQREYENDSRIKELMVTHPLFSFLSATYMFFN